MSNGWVVNGWVIHGQLVIDQTTTGLTTLSFPIPKRPIYIKKPTPSISTTIYILLQLYTILTHEIRWCGVSYICVASVNFVPIVNDWMAVFIWCGNSECGVPVADADCVTYVIILVVWDY